MWSPGSILYATATQALKYIVDGSDYLLGVAAKVRNAAGTIINPSSEETLASVDAWLAILDTTLDSIKDTAGIKKITDPLPAGDNNIGNVDVASSVLPTGAATETKLEAVRVLLNSLDGKDYATQTTLATLATDTALLAVRDRIGEVSDTPTANTLQDRLKELEATLTSLDNKDFSTQTTLAAVLTKLAEIDTAIDAINLTTGIKKITDELPTGTKEIGSVKQGTKTADNENAWPFIQVDEHGNYATITHDQGVNRQEIAGKVTIVGALPPPSTTLVEIFADTPLTVSTNDTTYVIPTGETFYLQQIVVGNEDPTKGAVIEVLFDDGTEHLIARIYTSGQTLLVGYSDIQTARDGTALLGAVGTSNIIVRRTKYSGTDIAIDAEVRGYRA